jgi:hypothetical protein
VRVPVRLLLAVGLLLVSGGLLAMTAIDSTSGWTTLIAGFLIAGAGIGLINPPLASTAVGVVHHSRSGMASGINNTFRQVGVATGVAGLGAIFQHEITHKTTAALQSLPGGARVLASSGSHLAGALVSGEVHRLAGALPQVQRLALTHAYRIGFTESLTSILLLGSAIALVGSVLALILVRGRDFVTSQQPEGAAEPTGADLATI